MVVCSKVESEEECVFAIIDRIMTSFYLARFVRTMYISDTVGCFVNYSAYFDSNFFPLYHFRQHALISLTFTDINTHAIKRCPAQRGGDIGGSFYFVIYTS